jgi:anti-sigma B factor antagonist
MYNSGPVIVMELPEKLKQAEVRTLMDDLRPVLETDRPRIVLDCSRVEHIDSAGVDMLLHFLHEAMKRDGDLKLAAVSPASAIVLEMMRVDRLFEVFETPEEAARSFHAYGSAVDPQTQPWYSAAFRAAELKAAG